MIYPDSDNIVAVRQPHAAQNLAIHSSLAQCPLDVQESMKTAVVPPQTAAYIVTQSLFALQDLSSPECLAAEHPLGDNS